MKKSIEIRGLGKQYHRKELGGSRYSTLRESLFKRTKQQVADYFWALKNVNLEIEQGTVLGIIGANGSGKSTLLKLLSRVTAPSAGEFILRGRVASLLEVGTGFHPELTGRENIYLSGAVMGMRRVEIQRKFDEIVDFSGVEGFLDLPVKRYSSGMYVRLGFAVAAHLEAEILLVDEVLAVGDAEFQKKCLGKIGDVAEGGRTVLFVSHNLGSVGQLCKESILMSHGKVSNLMKTEEVIQQYVQNIYTQKPARVPERKKGVGIVRIIDFEINNVSVWNFQTSIDGSNNITIKSGIYIDDDRPIQINIGIFANGLRIFTLQDIDKPTPNFSSTRTIWSRFTIPANTLRAGKYYLGLGGNINGVAGDWFWSDNFCSFNIIETRPLSKKALDFGVVYIDAETRRL